MEQWVEEGGVWFLSPADCISLHDTGKGFYNPKMRVYRDLVVMVARSICEASQHRPFHFVDPFCGCGVLGMRILECIKFGVEADKLVLTLNDKGPDCQRIAKRNTQKLLEDSKQTGCSQIRVCGFDANLLLRAIGCGEDGFLCENSCNHFLPASLVHLDPFGCVTPYLESAIAALDMRKNGNAVLSLTATDIGTLVDRGRANILKRHYSVFMESKRDPLLYKEQVVRILLGAVQSACGRCHGGDASIEEVLLAVGHEHFFLVCARISYKHKNSDFMKMSSSGEGPFWMGPTFSQMFLTSMSKSTSSVGARLFDDATIKLLDTLIEQDGTTAHIPWFIRCPRVDSGIKPTCIVNKLRMKNIAASTTIFAIRGDGIKTDCEEGELDETVQELMEELAAKVSSLAEGNEGC